MRALVLAALLVVLVPPPPAGRGDPSPRRWAPAPGAAWQWQLDGRLDLSVPAAVYDVDLDETPASAVRALHARGRRAVCYLSAGSVERWRADADELPRAVVGRPLEGWPGERWLDVRRLDVLLPWLERRLDRCAAKGFDGVEPDNVDAWEHRTGFPIRARDQLRFNRAVARAAHARGLSVGLKNDLAQARALEPAFDWALSEECFARRECGLLRPFLRAGKAVVVVEYDLPRSAFCPRARALGVTALRKRPALGAWRRACPGSLSKTSRRASQPIRGAGLPRRMQRQATSMP